MAVFMFITYNPVWNDPIWHWSWETSQLPVLHTMPLGMGYGNNS